jgi:hypothetical protein
MRPLRFDFSDGFEIAGTISPSSFEFDRWIKTSRHSSLFESRITAQTGTRLQSPKGPQAVIVCALSSYDWLGRVVDGGNNVGMFVEKLDDGSLLWKAEPPIRPARGRWIFSVILLWNDDLTSNRLDDSDVLFRQEIIIE